MQEVKASIKDKAARAGRAALALTLAVSMCVPAAAVMQSSTPQAAQAASSDNDDVVSHKRGKKISYGGWSTYHAKAALGDGEEEQSFCVAPSKNSLKTAKYKKTDLKAKKNEDGKNYSKKQFAALLWYSYGGPGFKKSLYPEKSWKGAAMTNDDYYVVGHILAADGYSRDIDYALQHAGSTFSGWMYDNILRRDDDGDLQKKNLEYKILMNKDGMLDAVPSTFVDNCYLYYDPAKEDTNQIYVSYETYDEPGAFKIKKVSSDESMTKNNPCYGKLSSARFGVWPKGDETKDTVSGTRVKVATKKGADPTVKNVKPGKKYYLDPGTYYVRELKNYTPENYQWSKDVWKLVIKANSTAVKTHTFKNKPNTDPGNLTLYKADQEVGEATGWKNSITNPKGKDLAGAEFTLKYYANLNKITSGTARSTWKFETNEQSLVEGIRNNKYPYGTYTFQETKAPEGYKLDSTIYTFILDAAHDMGSLSFAQGKMIPNTPKRNDLKITKKDGETTGPMKSVAFVVSLLDSDGKPVAGQQHLVATNAEGVASTTAADVPHTANTNAGDAAVKLTKKGVEGSYTLAETAAREDGYGVGQDGVSVTIDEDALNEALSTPYTYTDAEGNQQTDEGFGTWFGLADDGTEIDPDDDKGALVAGRYAIYEFDTSATGGYQLLDTKYVTVTDDSKDAEAATVDLANWHPSVTTSLTDADDGDKVVVNDPETDVVDSVTATNLYEGRSYTLKAKLYDKAAYEQAGSEAAEPVATTDSTFKTAAAGFTTDKGGEGTYAKEDGAEVGTATVEVPMTLDTSAFADGTQLVMTEELYDDAGRLLSSHIDIADEAQTVTVDVPDVATTATDAADGGKTVAYDPDSTITVDDAVSVKGIRPNKDYRVIGTLMYLDADGDAHEVVDDGQAVTSSADIAAGEVVDPETKVSMTFDAHHTTLVNNTDLVVYEKLYRVVKTTDEETGEQGEKLVEIASHEDPKDEGQTVKFLSPTVGTTAVDGLDGDKVAVNDPETEIVDTVAYEGLTAGASYKLYGVLMDQTTGLPYVVSSAGIEKSELAQWWSQLSAALNLPETAEGSEAGQALTLKAADTPVSWAPGNVNAGNLVAGKSYKVSVADGYALQRADSNAEDAEWKACTSGAEQFDVPAVETATADGYRAYRAVDSEGNDAPDALITFTPIATGSAASMPAKADLTAVEALLSEDNKVAAAVATSTASVEPGTADAADSGTAKVTFKLDASGAAGGLTVFEALVKTSGEAAKTVANHADLADEGQTVTVKPREIGTTAVDAADGDKTLKAGSTVTVTDTVAYSGCIAGEELKLVGTLYDKETGQPLTVNGSQVTSDEVLFTATGESGEAQVNFTFDTTGLDGKKLVAFEYMYKSDVQVASHEDIDDGAQTVIVDKPGLDKTGMLWVVLLGGGAAAATAALIARRRMRATADVE